jgi:ribosomal protein L29
MSGLEQTMKELRVELSNLRDDVAVIESSEIFAKNSIGNPGPLKAIRDRIAELETILERNE